MLSASGKQYSKRKPRKLADAHSHNFFAAHLYLKIALSTSWFDGRLNRYYRLKGVVARRGCVDSRESGQKRNAVEALRVGCKVVEYCDGEIGGGDSLNERCPGGIG